MRVAAERGAQTFDAAATAQHRRMSRHLRCRLHNAVLSWMRAAGIFSAFLCGVGHRQDTRRCATIRHRVSRRCAVSESDYSRRHALECMRMAADCMQLAGDVQNPALQSHFVRMARVWSDLAVRRIACAPNAAAVKRCWSNSRWGASASKLRVVTQNDIQQ